MSNDAARHQLEEVLALVQEQMADIADLQQKRAKLTAKATAADGAVEVTVNAQGTVIETVIDESYLADFDFADLGAHITAAAQSAAREIERRSAELLAPLTERRRQFPPISDVVNGVPDLGDLIPDLGRCTDAGHNDADAKAADSKEDSEESSSYPTVRR